MNSGFLTAERADGTALRIFYAEPNVTTPSTPSVVLAMHLFGIDAAIRESAQTFARAGFAVAVPDLYSRFEAPDGDVEADHRKFIPFAQALDVTTVDPDIRGAARFLNQRFPQSKTAIAGFCMGGVVAMKRAAGYADIFSAAAIWYGLSADVKPEDVDIPIVASYGADDAGIPVSTVEAFCDRLAVPNDITIYPGAGHAFCDNTRPAYRQIAAQDSWRRTMDFLRRYL